MKIEKIRELTAAELESELKKTKNELFNLRFQHVTGQLENPIRMSAVKRDIARIKTVIRENELAAEKAIG
jgi:ribosomal protein L29